jgi:hypothetical protein
MEPDNKATAMNLISVHGIRAQAVAHERLEEARLQGDASGLARWQKCQARSANCAEPAPHLSAPSRAHRRDPRWILASHYKCTKAG